MLDIELAELFECFPTDDDAHLFELPLNSLLYQASRLLNDFSDEGTPRASIEETPCPSPDRQSRERLDSRCFDSERIFRKRCVCGVARRLPTSVDGVGASRRWRDGVGASLA